MPISHTIRDLSPNNSLLERLLNIPHQILAILNPTANSHKIVKHAGRLPLLLRNPRMRHAAGHLDQALHPAQALRQGEYLRGLAEALCGGGGATDPEREHASAHAVAVLCQGDGVLRVRRQARVVYGDDVRRGLQRFAHRRCVVGCRARAKVQRFEAPVCEPAVEWRRHGADGVLQEGEPLVEGWGVECRGAHEHVRVAVDILCYAVYHNVGAVVERVLDVRGEEGVVDDDHYAVVVGDGGDSADVDEGERRVGGRLDPDQFGFRFDHLGDFDLNGGREGDLDAVG